MSASAGFIVGEHLVRAGSRSASRIQGNGWMRRAHLLCKGCLQHIHQCLRRRLDMCTAQPLHCLEVVMCSPALSREMLANDKPSARRRQTLRQQGGGIWKLPALKQNAARRYLQSAEADCLPHASNQSRKKGPTEKRNTPFNRLELGIWGLIFRRCIFQLK